MHIYYCCYEECQYSVWSMGSEAGLPSSINYGYVLWDKLLNFSIWVFPWKMIMGIVIIFSASQGLVSHCCEY